MIAFYMDYVLTLAAPSRHLTTVLLDIMVFNRGRMSGCSRGISRRWMA
mgnify:CR=1 FL=1